MKKNNNTTNSRQTNKVKNKIFIVIKKEQKGKCPLVPAPTIYRWSFSDRHLNVHEPWQPRYTKSVCQSLTVPLALLRHWCLAVSWSCCSWFSSLACPPSCCGFFSTSRVSCCHGQLPLLLMAGSRRSIRLAPAFKTRFFCTVWRTGIVWAMFCVE